MSTTEDWGWVNWYATRRHLPDMDRTATSGRFWALCGKTVPYPIAEDAKRRHRNWEKPKNYDAIPKCKFCQRKSGAA